MKTAVTSRNKLKLVEIALLVGLAHRMGADVSATFAELEEIWNAYGVFGKVDDE